MVGKVFEKSVKQLEISGGQLNWFSSKDKHMWKWKLQATRNAVSSSLGKSSYLWVRLLNHILHHGLSVTPGSNQSQHTEMI